MEKTKTQNRQGVRKMKKIIRDNTGSIVGIANTTEKKGTSWEGASAGGYATEGHVAETLSAFELIIGDASHLQKLI